MAQYIPNYKIEVQSDGRIDWLLWADNIATESEAGMELIRAFATFNIVKINDTIYRKDVK